jgi:hypothetical protein
MEAPLAEAAAVQGDRGARCAAAEALAGILACREINTGGEVAAAGSGGKAAASAAWAGPLLLKHVMEAGAYTRPLSRLNLSTFCAVRWVLSGFQ